MARRVICLLGNPHVLDNSENVAAEAITPGHIVAFDSSGNVIKNATAAANVNPRVALERDELGKDIDVAYASGDRVKVGSFGTGDHFYGFIPSGQNVTKGDYLTTDATGCMTKTSVSAHVRRFQALESVNNTAGPANTRIRVVVI